MGFLIGLLTAILLINCVLLVLLVLIQLPKKEAGLGLAFGGGAADALFGSGSGNVMTKATKYAAVMFFVLCIVLGILQGRYFHRDRTDFERALQRDTAAPTQTIPTTPSTGVPTPPPPATDAVPGTPIVVPPADGTATPPVVPPAPTEEPPR